MRRLHCLLAQPELRTSRRHPSVDDTFQASIAANFVVHYGLRLPSLIFVGLPQFRPECFTAHAVAILTRLDNHVGIITGNVGREVAPFVVCRWCDWAWSSLRLRLPALRMHWHFDRMLNSWCSRVDTNGCDRCRRRLCGQLLLCARSGLTAIEA